MNRAALFLLPMLSLAGASALQANPAQSSPAAPSAQAQAPAPAAAPAAAAPSATMPEAKPQDVDSIDHAIAALYDVISGPAGQPRDWSRFRSLFIPEARLIPNGVRPDGAPSHTALSVEDYVSRASRGFAQQGFFESETSRTMEQYDRIAHVFSTYQSKHEKDGAAFAHGINSIQLLNDGKRWYIVTIMWEGETEQHPIPPEYQKHK